MCLCACLSSWAAQSSYQDWQFTTGETPAAPTAGTNSAGTAQASIFPGTASSGWLPSLEGFGTQTGFWDLGMRTPNDLTNARVVLTIPNPLDAGGNAYTDLSVWVVQFIDGAFYPGDLTFSIPGAIPSGRTVIEDLSGGSLPGSWVEDNFRWHLAPAPEQLSLSITGAVGGTVVDRIRVEASSPTAPVKPLVISSVGMRGQVLGISWQGGLPPYQVYVSTNVVDSAAWQPLGLPTSQSTAEVPIDRPVAYVEVRGSN